MPDKILLIENLPYRAVLWWRLGYCSWFGIAAIMPHAKEGSKRAAVVHYRALVFRKAEWRLGHACLHAVIAVDVQ
jgi:hypothetical protein